MFVSEILIPVALLLYYYAVSTLYCSNCGAGMINCRDKSACIGFHHMCSGFSTCLDQSDEDPHFCTQWYDKIQIRGRCTSKNIKIFIEMLKYLKLTLCCSQIQMHEYNSMSNCFIGCFVNYTKRWLQLPEIMQLSLTIKL